MAKSPPKTEPTENDQQWPAWLRLTVSAALFLHLAAVIAPPLNFATVGNGPARGVYRLLRPYSQAAYIDHGYFFFAPDPGASHLVRFRAEFEGDREPLVDLFPDKKKQWPRLLYHRHFMLTEHLHAAYAPPEPPPGLDDRAMAEWSAAREIYEARRNGFKQHLKAKYNAKDIKLTRVEHRPPDPLEFLEGRRLDDEQLYVDLPETPPVRAGQGGPEVIPAGGGPATPLGPIGPIGPPLRPAHSSEVNRPPRFLEPIGAEVEEGAEGAEPSVGPPLQGPQP